MDSDPLMKVQNNNVADLNKRRLFFLLKSEMIVMDNTIPLITKIRSLKSNEIRTAWRMVMAILSHVHIFQ